MIDNFEQIKKLLKFDSEDEFYFLQIIQRKKDHKEAQSEFVKVGSNNSSRLIKAYYIYSAEELDKYKFEIVELCKLFGARAGISLNRRNNKDISLEMLSLLASNIKSGHYKQLSKLYSTICGQHHSDKDKTWIVDIDHQDMEIVNEIISFINKVEPISENKILALIPSKNGYHLITNRFNSKKFGDAYPDIELHKNNPTNLYIP
jgi:hypothetical protein